MSQGGISSIPSPFPASIRRVGLFSISGVPDEERVQRGLERLRQWGVEAVLPRPVHGPVRYLYTTDEERAELFNGLLADERVDCLMALKGGFGATRILDRIDWELLRRRGIPVIGYSDVTALHLAALGRGCTGCIAGPMLCSTLGDPGCSAQDLAAALDSLGRTLRGEAAPLLDGAHLAPMKAGFSQGMLVPANLSLLCSLMGTKYLPHLGGCVLVLEDVGEPAHAIDRMLSQLRNAGILGELAGLAFGQFSGGEDAEYLPGILADYAACVPGPVVGNVPFGHVHPSMSLPVGRRCSLSVADEGGVLQVTWGA